MSVIEELKELVLSGIREDRIARDRDNEICSASRSFYNGAICAYQVVLKKIKKLEARKGNCEECRGTGQVDCASCDGSGEIKNADGKV